MCFAPQADQTTVNTDAAFIFVLLLLGEAEVRIKFRQDNCRHTEGPWGPASVYDDRLKTVLFPFVGSVFGFFPAVINSKLQQTDSLKT